MEGATTVKNAAFTHVTLTYPCVQGMEDLALGVQIRIEVGFCTRERKVSSTCEHGCSHNQDLTRRSE